MKEISLRDLLEAGCHFGHQTSRWHPKMKPYLFTARDGIHIFDLVKTKAGLEEAYKFVEETVAAGGEIVFVGAKRQAQEGVKEAAEKVKVPYLTKRWIGGLLTNWEQIKKRLDYLSDLKAKKESGGFAERTKKENLLIAREIAKMEKDFGGLIGLKQLPAAIFVTDAKREVIALREAKRRGVKTVAIADSNVDPGNIDYIIPANDDAVRSIQYIVGVIAEAVEEGRKQAEVQKKEPSLEPVKGLKVGKEDKKEEKKIEKKKTPKAKKGEKKDEVIPSKS